MGRPFLSSCRQIERKRRRRAALLLPAIFCAVLSACASGPGGKPFEGWPADAGGATNNYLAGLREYLALPAGEQAAHRERLRAASEHGGPVAELEYAFALSVDRDDRARLESARAYFEALLAAPDPLPVALDALVRLQLGQVIDRLQRMKTVADTQHAYRAAVAEQRMCLAQLRDTKARLEDMRLDLSEVRRKLDALARIEQTVNHGQEPQEPRRTPPRENDNGSDAEENDDDAERQPDTARR